MPKFKKELFYSADEWLADNNSELIKDPETYYLMNQARLARIALEGRLEVVMVEGVSL